MAHAFLYISTTLDNSAVPEFTRTQSVDVSHVGVDSFGIDDARELREQAARLPLTRPTRVFLLQVGTFTIEAQNALLKLFEDPPETAEFHVVVKREDVMIPTLRSRFLLRSTSVETVSANASVLATLQTQTPGEQLVEVATRVKNKDMAWCEAFLADVEQYAAKQANPGLLQSVLLARSYFGMRGAANKMLLEELVLALAAAKR